MSNSPPPHGRLANSEKISTIRAINCIGMQHSFLDVGRVFDGPGIVPLSQLHSVGGLGIRGLARPFVVGYIDVGHGSEGVAVFTGIDYPF